MKIIDIGGEHVLGRLPSTKADASVQEMLQMMDVVDALRVQQGEVQQQLTQEAQGQDLRQRLQKTYEQMGVTVTDALLERAIQDHFTHKYEFVPPRRDGRYTLAKWYVDRKRIGRVYGLPVLILGALGGLGYGLVEAGKAAYHHNQESRVESAIEAAYQQRQGLEGQAQRLAAAPLKKDLPPPQQLALESIVSVSRGRLQATEQFFAEFSPEGKAEKAVTTQNYPRAQEQLERTASHLTTAKTELQRGEAIVQTQQQLAETRQRLDATYASVKEKKAQPVFLERATAAYTSGVKNLEARELPGAAASLQQLTTIYNDSVQFADLARSVEVSYQSIRGVVKEKETREQADILYKSAQQELQSVNVPVLRATVGRLQTLDATLHQEYELRIVSEPGVRSGIYRNYGGQISGYYLLVEAIASDGSTLPMKITSTETGSTAEVTRWAEQVPESAYELVKQDKSDDGLIQDNIVARKKKGYLQREDDVRFSLLNKQITAW